MKTVSFVVNIFQSHASVGVEGKLRQRLDKNAVPSIFPQFPKNLKIIKKKIKSPAIRKIIEKPCHDIKVSLFMFLLGRGRHVCSFMNVPV